MSRPVPEAAPIVGLVLAFAFALFGLLFSSDHLATVLGTVVLLYPFVLFGVMRSEDPAAAVPPDAVLAVGFVGGTAVGLYGVAVGRPLPGAFVAAVVAVPTALYHVRYARSVSPLSPGASLAAGLLTSAVLLAGGIRASRPLLAGLSAALVGLAAVDYRRQRGGPIRRRTRTAAVLVGLGGGLSLFAALAMAGRPTVGLVVGAVLVAIGAAMALDADRR